MTDLPEAVPAFLRLTRAQRAAAWERNPPRPMPAFNDEPRSRLTDADREFIARYEAIAAAVAERKKQKGLESLRAYKEEQAKPRLAAAITDKQAIEAVKAEARQRHTKPKQVKKHMRKKRSKAHQ